MHQSDLRFPLPIGRIAEFIGGTVQGDPQIFIGGVGDPSDPKPEDIVFVWTKPQALLAYASAARAVVTSPQFVQPTKPTIIVPDPRLALAKFLDCLFRETIPSPTISPFAVISPDAQIGQQVCIGSYAVIGSQTVIGDRTIIYPLSYIGNRVTIGQDCRIYPFACLLDDVSLGNRVVIFSGAVVGRPGFGFVWDGQQHRRVPQVGKVVVEDDAEIGANSCVDRATLTKTRIGKGSKLDNLVQIGHNCQVGPMCLIAGQVGLAGSVTLGEGVVVGGQAGIADHITVGPKAQIAARSGLMSNVPEESRWAGFPARPHWEWLRIEASLTRLPELILLSRTLKEKVEQLEKRLAEAQAKKEGGRRGGKGHRRRS
ncbi:MAG: UDP-3-O-(3-hydroxymyristoyl)glucosamine N-acyltransferase [Armatimonadetes bacterium]|nr:UDP-3-O-(3-hydroxymyristoyl)glucosamine N-acyltransferase [Armatimonadota bacterium]MDW8122820.1 UDP-3-O-(3-hydroxymyristoyl)glucosamine N-acyltransferase [Armatimonadota bacterium]